jgi:CRP-like cAMP-binding protein
MMRNFRETFGRLNLMYRLYRVLQMKTCLRLNYVSVTKRHVYLKLNSFRDDGEISFKE